MVFKKEMLEVLEAQVAIVEVDKRELSTGAIISSSDNNMWNTFSERSEK